MKLWNRKDRGYAQKKEHSLIFFDITVDSTKYPKVGYSSRLIETLGRSGNSFGLKNGVRNTNIEINIWNEEGEELIFSTRFHFDY